MKEHSLIASVALFGGLYNSSKYNHITDIVAEFIKGAVCTEQRWFANSTELKFALQRVYDFTIPEAVIKTTLKNRMKKLFTYRDGIYSFDAQALQRDSEIISKEYSNINEIQKRILQALYEHIETTASIILDEPAKDEVKENFVKYLLDNTYNETYGNQISAFIIKNRLNAEFINNLNQIKEGLILYQGVRYTSDVNDLGSWKSELKIFLNTEYLFHAVGYNGEVYKQMFYDLLDLINKINQKSRNKKGERLIELRYLPETEKEVESFFQSAEHIKRGNKVPDPGRAAMREILKGCSSPMDIKAKKISFIKEINQLGIFLQEINTSAYSYPEYIIEDKSSIGRLTGDLKERGRQFIDDDYEYFSSIFTKVNFYRDRRNDKPFDKIGHIFLTQKWFALWLAHHPTVRTNDTDIPFALPIENVTSKFWFKLCKGFGDSTSLPKSLEVITRAQVILSSQLNASVSKVYDDLQQAYKAEKHDKEWFLEMSHGLREKSKLPEEIDDTTLDESLDFIMEENYIERFHKDKEHRDQQFAELALQNNDLQNELEQYKNLERQRQEEDLQAKRDQEKIEYVLSKRREYQQTVNGEIAYFIKAGSVLFLALILLALSKVGFIARYAEDMGWWADVILLVFVIFGANELFMRTFILDKEKVKRGRKEFWLKFQPESRKEQLRQQAILWEKAFEENLAA